MVTHICYVCGNMIRAQAVYVGRGLYMHPSSCGPGSARYMQNRPLAAAYCQLLGRTEVAMKAKDVVIGGTYVVKVSDKPAKVRIASAHVSGKGWVGKNLDTGREVHIKSPQRLRAEVKPQTASGEAARETTAAPQGARVAKKAAGQSKHANGQKKPTQAKTGARAAKKAGVLRQSRYTS